MKPLILKSLSEQDLPSVLTLDQTCFGGLWTRSGYQREIESPNSNLLILITPDQPNSSPEGTQHLRGRRQLAPKKISPRSVLPPGTVVGLGCLWAILDEAHITLLAVDPRVQRQGLGQALLYALLMSAQRRGLDRATLEVRASNQSALDLYRKFGFRVAGERPGYYPDGESALILWRSGLNHLASSRGGARATEAGDDHMGGEVKGGDIPSFQHIWQQQVGDRLRRSGWLITGL